MFLKTFSKKKSFSVTGGHVPLLFGVVPFFQRMGRKIGKKKKNTARRVL
jgi:hypothetical protein